MSHPTPSEHGVCLNRCCCHGFAGTPMKAPCGKMSDGSLRDVSDQFCIALFPSWASGWWCSAMRSTCRIWTSTALSGSSASSGRWWSTAASTALRTRPGSNWSEFRSVGAALRTRRGSIWSEFRSVDTAFRTRLGSIWEDLTSTDAD